MKLCNLSVNGQTNHPFQPTYLILWMPPPPHKLDIDASGGTSHVVWAMSPSVLQYLIKIHPPRNFYLIVILITRQETLGYLASCSHNSLQMNTNTPLAWITLNSNVFWILSFNSSFQFFGIIVSPLPLILVWMVPLLKCLFHTVHNARNSKYVDALKFQLVRHDTFYNGQNQQDSNECLLMLINIIYKGSMPDSSSTTYPMGAPLSDILFSFVLEKYIVSDVCRLRSPSFESSSVLYISPTDTSSMHNLILQGLQQKLQKPCSRCNKNIWHVESS